MVGVNEGIDPHPDSYIRLDSISLIMGFERVTNLGGFAGRPHSPSARTMQCLAQIPKTY